MKLVVAVGGASGSVYAQRLLDTLAAMKPGPNGRPEVGVVVSKAGVEVWRHELGEIPVWPFPRYDLHDFRAPFASGSAGWDAMVVVPVPSADKCPFRPAPGASRLSENTSSVTLAVIGVR